MKQLLRTTTIIFFTFLFIFPISTFAKTLEEIEDEIEQKEKELEELNNQVNGAQTKLNSTTAAKNSAQGKLNQLKTSIELIQSQVEFNTLKTEQLKQSAELKVLEKEIREEKQDKQIKSAYLSWKSSNYVAEFFNGQDILKTATYHDLITNNEQTSIEGLARELSQLETDLADFIKESDDLNSQILGLEEEKKSLEQQIALINQQINNEAAALAAAKSKANATQQQIEFLSQEQKALQDYEAWILGQSGNGGTLPVVPGEFYFTGRGRDVAQGHGVGFSQNGGLGASLAGWNYKQILQFYYPGATVAQYTDRTEIPVQNYGILNIDTYVAGLGEVPSNGCEDLGVPFGQLGYWGCWPKESIKAQIVAARAYALNYTKNGAAICTSASCQVYNGGEAKRQLADETTYEVVVLNGQPINALYSAQNNQGFGTANNDTVWNTREGNGTPVSYLRAANDNGFYYPAAYSLCGNSDCAKWGYRSNSYTMAEIQSMLSWSITSPSPKITQGDRTFLTSVLNDVGQLNTITFEKDPSQRNHRVVLNGSNGSRKMAGWFFKSLWNIWIYEVRPSGQEDYLFSLTYFILQG